MALAPSFAITRIQPPRRPAAWVDRPVLQVHLRDAVHRHALTLICAAAGYGKTAALAQLIHDLPPSTALAWVTADEDEQLPGFLACLCAALEPLDLPWDVSPDALATLALADLGLRDVATALVNALAGLDCERGLVVLDDAHRIVDARVFELLQRLVERLPAHWGIVVSSRAEPPLALARLRASGDLAEVRQPDLQFDAAEVEALVRRLQPPASGSTATRPVPAPGEAAGRARALLARTQGWVAALRLSLSVGAAGGPGTGPGERVTQRHLFDFLATEVMAEMPGRLREFLLCSAVLPELTAARAAKVTGMDDAASLLDDVDRRGLFVNALATAVPTLRLHDLFRDFLEDRLRREQPALWARALIRAAEDEPDVARAVTGLARAGAWIQARDVLLERGPALLAAGAGSTLEQLLAQFPAAQYDAMPDLWMLRGLTCWPGYDFDGLLRCMHEAAAGYAVAGRERDAALASAHLCAGLQHIGRFGEGTRILARLGRLSLDDAAMAFIHYGEACDAVVCGRSADVAPNMARMLGALQRVPDAGLWMLCPLQVMLLGAPGSVDQCGRYADAILQLAGEHPSPLRAGARHLRTWQSLLAGRIDEAAQWLALADEDCRWLGRPRLIQTDNRMTHALFHALRGEADASSAASRELIDDIRRSASASYRRVHEPALLATAARGAWMLQDGAALRRLASEMEAAATTVEWPSGRGMHALCLAMVDLLDGRIDAAIVRLDGLADRIECHFLCPGPPTRALLGWALRQAGRLDEAARALRPVLQDPGRSGEQGAVVFAGMPVLADLAATPWGDRLSAGERAILDEMTRRARLARAQIGRAEDTAPEHATPQDATPQNATLEHANLELAPPNAANAGRWFADVLTPREEQILDRLAAGASNKLIAQALDLSVHTVKQHVASILGKLAVGSRGQAAACWHARR